MVQERLEQVTAGREPSRETMTEVGPVRVTEGSEAVRQEKLWK